MKKLKQIKKFMKKPVTWGESLKIGGIAVLAYAAIVMTVYTVYRIKTWINKKKDQTEVNNTVMNDLKEDIYE